MFAFQITEVDVETVLRNNSALVINPEGKSFAEMAESLVDEIDHDRVEKAALDSSCDLDEQTDGAHDEIKTILGEMGVLTANASV